MSSTARQNANRANAKKSTGPKTAEGKARSALNAMTHGLTAQQAVLPNEDPDAYIAAKAAWIDTLLPSDTIELALVERAVIADWRLGRCVRAERARLASRVRHAAEQHDLERFKRAEELGHQLIYDPLNRCHVPAGDPETLRKLLIWRGNNPAAIVREMQGFKEGVDWMIARWLRIGGILQREGFWHYSEKFEAIRLMGLRPDDALNVELVGTIFLACRVLHPEPWDITADFQQAALGCEGRPIYSLRTERLEEKMPKTADQAFEILGTIAEREVSRLRQFKEKLDDSAAIDRREAEDRAMLDDSKGAALALRYESARDRELRRSLADLQKKRKDEEASANRRAEVAQIEPEVVTEEHVVKNAPTPPAAPPNEANDGSKNRSTKPSGRQKRDRKRQKSSPIRLN